MSDFHTLTPQEKDFVIRYSAAQEAVYKFNRVIKNKQFRLANYYNVLAHLNNFSENELYKYPTFVGILSLMRMYVDNIYSNSENI